MPNSLFSKKITSIYISDTKIVVAQVSKSFKKINLDNITEGNLSDSDVVGKIKDDSEPDKDSTPFKIKDNSKSDAEPETDFEDEEVSESDEDSGAVFEDEDEEQAEPYNDSKTAFEIDVDEDSDHVEILKGIIDEHDFQLENVVLLLPSKYSMLRYFNLPKMSKNEINSAVKFEAKKYIPFSLDEIETDYYVINDGKNDNEIGILFAAVKKEALQEKLSVLEQCNIEPKNIKLASLSLLNAIDRNRSELELEKSKSYGMIDVNESVATITIFKNGVPYLVRDFSLSAPNSSEELISEQDYENFVHELHLSMEYYYGQANTGNINKIFLFDDGTLREKIANLSSEFNIPIIQPDISKVIKGVSKKDISFQNMLVVSAAVNKCLKSKIDIDIVPSKEKVKSVEMKFDFKNFSVIPKFIFIEVVTLVIAALALYVIMDRWMVASVQKQIDAVKKERKKVLGLSYVDISKRKFKKILTDTLNKRSLVSGILEDRVYVTDKLNRLAANLSDDMWFTSLDYGSDVEYPTEEKFIFFINGIVFLNKKKDEMQIINNFLRDLKDDPIFMQGLREVDLVSVNKGSEKGFSVAKFRLKCR